MVYAGAIDEHLLAIEHEAVLRIIREGADAELHMSFIDDLPVGLQFDDSLIEIGIVRRPQMGIVDVVTHHKGGYLSVWQWRILYLSTLRLVSIHIHHGHALEVAFGLVGNDDVRRVEMRSVIMTKGETASRETDVNIVYLLGIASVVFHPDIHINPGVLGISVGSPDAHTIIGEMQRRHRLQPHMAIDA